MTRPRTIALILAATPVGLMATYIAWCIVPMIVAEIVPTVARAVATN